MTTLRFVFRVVLLIIGAGVAGMGAGAARAEQPTLWLIGDSTVKNGTKDLRGWGEEIGVFFDPAKITVQNRALGGRSSRTFLTEGLWDKVEAEIKPGDFVLMQFGHNDAGDIHKGIGPGRPSRASLKGNGDETEEITSPRPANRKRSTVTGGICVTSSRAPKQKAPRRWSCRWFRATIGKTAKCCA